MVGSPNLSLFPANHRSVLKSKTEDFFSLIFVFYFISCIFYQSNNISKLQWLQKYSGSLLHF